MATPTRLQKRQGKSFGHVLFSCARLLDLLAQAEVNRQAGSQVARPALMRLLPYLDFEGIRPTELARRVDVSKQAIGQALSELVEQGMVEFVPDPSDGRARLVRLTAFGGDAFTHGLEVLAGFEKRLAKEIGARRLEETFAALADIHAALERWSEQQTS